MYNYNKYAVDAISVELTRIHQQELSRDCNGRIIWKVNTRKIIDPPPPNGFDAFLKSFSKFYPPNKNEKKKMYFFCADNRKEFLEWFKKVKIKAVPLFGYSFYILLNKKQYEALRSLGA